MNKKIKITLMISFVVLGTILAITFGTQKEVLPIGSSLPKLKYVSLNGSGIISTKNKPIMIMFFKPDCPYCEYEFETINKGIDELNNVDVFFLTTDKQYIQNNTYDRWKTLINKSNVVFAAVDEKIFKKEIGINITPLFLFYNKHNCLINKIIGETKFDRLVESIKKTGGAQHQSRG